MSALTAPRNTVRLGDDVHVYDYRIAADVVIWQGGLVVLASGRARPGYTGVGLRACGVANRTYDNTSGADAAFEVAVTEGVFLFDNSASSDSITDLDLGADCYVVDDRTVAKTNGSGTRSVAGKVRKITSAGVFVHVKLA